MLVICFDIQIAKSVPQRAPGSNLVYLHIKEAGKLARGGACAQNTQASNTIGFPVVLSMQQLPYHKSPWISTGLMDFKTVRGLNKRGITFS